MAKGCFGRGDRSSEPLDRDNPRLRPRVGDLFGSPTRSGASSVGGLKARIQAHGPNEFAMTVSLLGVHAAEAPYDPSIASDRRAFRLQ